MSENWVQDINDMHKRFGVHRWVGTKVTEGDKESLIKFLKFRIDFLKEELAETEKAFEGNDAEEIVDGLIDLCVVAIGTLDAFGVDAHKAWDAVHAANMAKEPGVKPSRPNPLGLPDLIKPTMETHGYNWEAPSHNNNHGLLKNIT
jgi:predicted HAD superfamily Cof-like phosphohydrolase